ncbi:tyrosine-type recombinase/integrase [Kitasatospora sp. NPDC057198]|uniref:tyrosine-type recombinase/integrase n=1 Tax=Kitasatospora sp. NPDC057198 TaxID=3346046 RepID=UPI00362C2886
MSATAFSAPPVAPENEDQARLRALLRPDFLARAGWDEAAGVLAPDRRDPLLGLDECPVVDCTAPLPRRAAKLCDRCAARHQDAGLAWEEFLRLPSGGPNFGDRACVVQRCPRPGRGREALCNTHTWQRTRYRDLTVHQWAALPEVVPLSDLGQCRVVACTRRAGFVELRLCHAHNSRWFRNLQDRPGEDLAQWLGRETSVATGQVNILTSLPERVRLEVLLALQQRTDLGLRTFPTSLRYLINLLHTRRAASLLYLVEVPSTSIRSDARTLLRSLTKELYCRLSDPEVESRRDRWNLQVFGLPGTLDFTPIRQRWLRETVKAWTVEDLPLRYGKQQASQPRQLITAITWLSESLHLGATEAGEVPDALGRADIVAFCNRMAHAERTGRLTLDTRIRLMRLVRRLLDEARQLGLTRADGPAAGLPGDFSLRRSDIPIEPERAEAGRDLPPHIIRTISANLHVLQERCGTAERRITEILIDTGRRPDEVCMLPWDCLDRDSTSQPVLVYTDFKNNRPGRRLPIPGDTAKVIAAQKQDVIARFPHTSVDELVLFPRDAGNRDGTKPIGADAYSNAHRFFIDAIAHMLIDHDGLPFNPAAVFPYTYRHSYAQRHADAGVSPDALRELMSHRSLRTTAGYYRVSSHRLRSAVDRVAQHQFDAAGNRVFQQAAALLADDDRTRIAVGQVAVPFGMCTEPSNVKAGGQACPFKYTCLGCGHFRSDPSYLPELKSYLQQLLADRERITAAIELPDWARAKLMPPSEQVDQLRALIRRIETDLDRLSDADRHQIQHAITALRGARQRVDLGMPTIRTPRTQTS